MGALGRATCTVQLISASDQPKGNKCTNTEEKLRAYCPNIYTVPHCGIHILIMIHGWCNGTDKARYSWQKNVGRFRHFGWQCKHLHFRTFLSNVSDVTSVLTRLCCTAIKSMDT